MQAMKSFSARILSPASPRNRRLELAVVLVGAVCLRLPFVLPSLPYLSYVDEGHVLHHVAGLIRDGGWDPDWYAYPSLTLYLIAGAFRLVALAYRLGGGRDLAAEIPVEGAHYDFVTPPELILVGRLVILAAGIGIVALGMAITRRLAGRTAALFAGVLLASCPALVQRSPIVIVDTVAACFALAALIAGLHIEDQMGSGEPRNALPWALAAGGLSGLAAAAKYPVGSVLIAVVGMIAFLRVAVRERITLATAATGAACAGAVIGMPALVLKPHAVLEALREQARLYSDPALMSWGAPPSQISALREALRTYEMGPVLPFLAVGSALVVFVMRRDLRRALIPWFAFAAVLLLSVLGFRFQPFRNLLALVPLLVIMVPIAIGTAIPKGRWRIGATALTTVAVLVSFVPGFVIIKSVYGRQDSRTTFIHRFAKLVRRGERVLVLRELAVLPGQLSELGAPVDVVSWHEAKAAAGTGMFSFVVFGELESAGYVPVAGEDLSELPAFQAWCNGLPPVLSVGSARTPMPPFLWRSADEKLVAGRLR